MWLKNFLEGRWLGHPLHPLLVHLPIGLWLLSLVLDIGSYASGGEGWMVQGAFYSMLIGIICALVAAVPGVVDWLEMRNDHPAQTVALYHLFLNLAATALYAVNLGIRYNTWDAVQTPATPLVLSIIGYTMIGISGYLGGMMVYEDGIGVGRHLTQRDLPQKTLHAASASGLAMATTAEPVADYVPVASDDKLEEGDTLRVEVNGLVLCVGRVAGQVYAVQEFCTHRCGPLSEGCLRVDQEGPQIQCPWHGSRFDLRTGRVTKGPANVELKTYPTRVSDGQVCVLVPATRSETEEAARRAAEATRRNPPEIPARPAERNRITEAHPDKIQREERKP